MSREFEHRTHHYINTTHLTSWIQKARGAILRGAIDDTTLVFSFNQARPRAVHMLFVPFALDVLWLVDEIVQESRSLSPWTGFGRARADTIVEVAAGRAADVEVGDRVVLE